jgi:hypothetical protein
MLTLTESNMLTAGTSDLRYTAARWNATYKLVLCTNSKFAIKANNLLPELAGTVRTDVGVAHVRHLEAFVADELEGAGAAVQHALAA